MEGDDKKKAHRVSKSSRKVKKTKDGKKEENVDPRIRNPKAFAFNSVVRAERKFRRTKDIETKKERLPQVDRTPVEAPPFIIAIVGPSKVGKSTLFHNLTKHFTRQTLHDVKGPVTIVSGKKRRLTLIECNNDINSMIDMAKVADLVLLLVDASFGFEMEIFEFLNICQVHGFPQIMGVLTHLDLFKNKTQLKKTKKTLKHRFWTEVYPGSKLFYLSGYHPMTNSYPKNEIHNLARFMSVMKFRQTLWRSEHSYVIADRMEDLTSPDDIRINPKIDRNICLYGFVHGTFLKPHVSVHIPGLGDYTPEAVTALDDPCPLPMKERVLRRSLNEKEKVIYAPFSGVGGIVYDHDAVYIDLGGSHSHHRKKPSRDEEENHLETVSPFVGEMRELKATLDEKMESSGLKLFSTSELLTSAEMVADDDDNDESDGVDNDMEENDEPEVESPIFTERNVHIVQASDGRTRRKVMFDDGDREDDVIQQIQTEIKKLKKKKRREPIANVIVADDGVAQDLDNYWSEDEVEEVKTTDFRLKMKSLTTSKPVEKIEHTVGVNVMNLAGKVKLRLNKQNSSGMTEKSYEHFIRQDFDVEEENHGEDDESSDEDEDELDEDEDELDEEIEDVDLEESVEEDITDDVGDEENDHESQKLSRNKSKTASEEKDFAFGEDPLSIEVMKKKRYEDAEDGFYSRFYKRSLQKMIYEDTTEYMNVGPKADFDLANCTVQEIQGKTVEVNLDEQKIKNLFIGGDYAAAAKGLLEADDSDVDDAFGDFEELDKPESTKNELEEISTLDPQVAEEKRDKKRNDMKKKLKEKFDMEYDDDGEGEKSFYKDLKSEVEEQTKVNRTFFQDVEDSTLLQDLQGLAPGSYIRVLLTHIPYEFVENFDPQAASPLIIGSLDSPNQETLAVIQARVKKHRWHPKILKTRDPIILSVGWRRFQTLALYSVHDHNMRNRMIKYTPEHLHCVANFYGPVTPQGTGILGIAPQGFNGFRITLTGTILDMDKSTELVKKLKLIGSPSKIFKKSTFIDGMFNSQLEVAKFIGAKIKSVSGVRGVIKKPLRAPPGSFRATFEDRILLSDIIFCRTWAKVEVPKFYLSLPNHIIPQPRLVKTLGQLKREGQAKVQPNPDHLYTPVERIPKEFKPLKIPNKLQNRLPYKDKPKVQAKLQELKRIAVIKEPHERKMTQLLKVMKSRMNEKEGKEKLEKAKKTAERAKVIKKLETKQNYRQKELRKKIFRTLGKIHKNPETVSGGGRGIRRQFQRRH